MISHLLKPLSFFTILLIASLLSCKDQSADAITTTTTEDKNFAATDWTTVTHSNDVDPDYTTVFPQDKVNTLTIAMTATDWSTIQTNMKALFG
ncbi:MAG: hypothetical protein ACK5RG_09860 [Cyclobacteriaceae bacterium]|jgi:spore coat protein H|nr:hypothetical protein [Flammeovirgaceae bacterium]